MGSRASSVAAFAVAVLLALGLGAGPARAQTAMTERVDLIKGCSNVAMTWPADTPIVLVSSAIAPAGVLDVIWKFDQATQLYLGYSPAVAQLSDLRTIGPLDAVYICTSEAAVLTRPVLAATPPVTGVASLAAAFIPPPRPLQVVGASTSAARGGNAAIRVSTIPNARCDITYIPPANSGASTTGLGPRFADASGTVSWAWTVALTTATGNATVVVNCAGGSVTVSITIV